MRGFLRLPAFLGCKAVAQSSRGVTGTPPPPKRPFVPKPQAVPSRWQEAESAEASSGIKSSIRYSLSHGKAGAKPGQEASPSDTSAREERETR